MRIAGDVADDVAKQYGETIDSAKKTHANALKRADVRANMPRRSGRVARMNATSTALTTLGAITNGYSVALNSPAESKTGKVVGGSAAFGTNLAFGLKTGKTAAVDAVTGGNVASAMNGATDFFVAGGESLATGDRTAFNNFNRKVENGEYGEIWESSYAAGGGVRAVAQPERRDAFNDKASRGELGYTAHATAAAAELAYGNGTEAAESLHENNMNGDNGVLFKNGATAGEAGYELYEQVRYGDSSGVEDFAERSARGELGYVAHASAVAAEAAYGNGTESMQRMHDKSMNNDYGVVLKTAAVAGEATDALLEMRFRSGDTSAVQDFAERAESGELGGVGLVGDRLGKAAYNALDRIGVAEAIADGITGKG